MKTYNVEITYTLRGVISIDANNFTEAEQAARETIPMEELTGNEFEHLTTEVHSIQEDE